MQCTDPIADLITRIRNGQMAKKEVVHVPASKQKIALTHVLKREGMIRNYKCIRDNKQGYIKIALSYDDQGSGVITFLKRESKPSLRRYVKSDDMPYVKNGFGFGIYSTSKGLLTDHECRKQKIGGEYLISAL